MVPLVSFKRRTANVASSTVPSVIQRADLWPQAPVEQDLYAEAFKDWKSKLVGTLDIPEQLAVRMHQSDLLSWVRLSNISRDFNADQPSPDDDDVTCSLDGVTLCNHLLVAELEARIVGLNVAHVVRARGEDEVVVGDCLPIRANFNVRLPYPRDLAIDERTAVEDRTFVTPHRLGPAGLLVVLPAVRGSWIHHGTTLSRHILEVFLWVNEHDVVARFLSQLTRYDATRRAAPTDHDFCLPEPDSLSPRPYNGLLSDSSDLHLADPESRDGRLQHLFETLGNGVQAIKDIVSIQVIASPREGELAGSLGDGFVAGRREPFGM
mmetsp:Transcript_24456/g.50826  ORF Transcript_24456/g.50826 Transcript_24456/m.50826 type:complete len:322 (-) Transcript_24456:725-1690(-)